jgi:hypothetical protein
MTHEQDSGIASLKQFGFCDHASLSVRTLQACLSQSENETGLNKQHSALFLRTFPSSGMMLNGKLLVPKSSAHPTSENECSSLPGTEQELLPTPVKYDATPCGPNNHYKGLGHMVKHNPTVLPTPQMCDWKGRGPNSQQQGLPEVLKERSLNTTEDDLRSQKSPSTMTLPTPRAQDMEGGPVLTEMTEGGFRSKRHRSNQWFGAKLKDAARLMPTPRNADAANPRLTQTHTGNFGNMLTDAVKLLPTPSKSDFKGVGQIGSDSHQNMLEHQHMGATAQAITGVSGRLNPRFVSWMMGLPPGWTDISGENKLKHWAMVSSRNAQKKQQDE